jgi:hypothetical protein
MSPLTLKQNRLLNVQEKIEKCIEKNYDVYKAAHHAYRNFILSSGLRDFHNIAKSFGLPRAPLVNGLND